MPGPNFKIVRPPRESSLTVYELAISPQNMLWLPDKMGQTGKGQVQF